MATLKVMLCCGAGMSSGFIASNARKVIRKNKLDVSVEARSHSEVVEYLGSIDVLLLGPHYAAELDDYKGMAAPYGVGVGVIPQSLYASLDGVGVIKLAQGIAANR